MLHALTIAAALASAPPCLLREGDLTEARIDELVAVDEFVAGRVSVVRVVPEPTIVVAKTVFVDTIPPACDVESDRGVAMTEFMPDWLLSVVIIGVGGVGAIVGYAAGRAAKKSSGGGW